MVNNDTLYNWNSYTNVLNWQFTDLLHFFFFFLLFFFVVINTVKWNPMWTCDRLRQVFMHDGRWYLELPTTTTINDQKNKNLKNPPQ